jgi:hypothetical protein
MAATEQMIAGLKGDIEAAVELTELRRSVRDYLAERGVGGLCDVEVRVDRGWYELAGRVDSHWTRAVLFSFVPPRNGRRYVIDKLKVIGAAREVGSAA